MLSLKYWAGAAALCLLLAFSVHQQAWAASPLPGAHILNVATSDYQDGNGGIKPRQSASVDTVINLVPSMSLTKQGAPGLVRSGNDIVYTLIFVNTGNVQLTGITVSDPVPTGTAFVSADSGGSVSAGTVTWDLGSMDPGDSRTVRLTVQVDTDVPGGDTITNTATASSNEAPEQSSTVNTQVLARTQGVVEICDPSWNSVKVTRIGDPIYLQVTDADQNLDPAVIETVTVIINHYIILSDGTKVIDDSVTITLYETGPDTGIFRASLPTDGGPSIPGDGTLSLTSDSSIEAVYTDPLDSMPSVDDFAFIDPYGVVFDSVTGLPVAGAVVTLIDNATGLPAILPQPPAVPSPQANPVTTGADGRYQFEFLNPGTYRLDVRPGGIYTFPSIVPTASLPPGYTIDTGSRGENFTIVVGMGALVLDVPVDAPAEVLRVTKTANKSSASIGDLVRYTVQIFNDATDPVTGVSIVDVMPHGVTYVRGSTRINGASAPDPDAKGKNTLVWTVASIPAGGSAEISYLAAVGPDSQKGSGVNTVQASGSIGPRAAASNKAAFRLVISEGVFTSKGLIIGKVFADGNLNRLQDAGEEGVPGVVIYMEDGTRVITGADGKYSVYGVVPGTHVLKVDETSLPKGAALEALSNRFMGDASSQFVDMPPGGFIKADFAVTGIEARGTEEKPASAPAEPQGPQVEEMPVEERIRQMKPELEILDPADGAATCLSHINVTVKAPLDAELALFVNGAKTDGGRIGKTIKDPASKVAIYEFINIELAQGEKNVIKAEIKDPFGNVRGAKEITLKASGRPDRIEITPGKAEATADGTAVTEFTARVLDASGMVVGYPGKITVETSAGEIADKDADSSEPGVQVIPSGGEARFRVISPRETGNATVTVLCNGLRETAQLFFSPHLRDIMAIGAGEVVAGYGTSRGSASLVDTNWFDKDFYFGGKGAFFIKGNIGWNTLLTAAFDSEKKKRDVGLFKEKINDVESEERYPIYGDDSRLGYEALSSDKLYLRLERGRSYLLYGDYQTALNAGGLAAFTRTFNGLLLNADTRYFKMRSFISRTENVQVVDSFLGRGIAGYYFLSKSPVVDGSEMVVIETRDRLQPDRVIGRTTMSRWTDYRIDYDLGSILFKAPVSSHDADLNPVYIIVSYETTDGRHYVYGGRAAVSPFEWLEAGFTGVVEENEISDYRLLGSDLTLNLPLKTTVKAEWAQTESLFTLGSVFTPKTGDAWSVKLDSNPLNNLKLNGYYYSTSNFFNNPSATNFMRGKESYGFDIRYQLDKDTLAQGKFFREVDRLNDSRNTFASAGMERSFSRIKIGLEALYQESNNTFVPVGSSSTRFPFDASEETPRRMTALRLFLDTRLWKDLSLNIQHTQDILHNRDNLTQAGLNYQYSPNTRFYVREQYLTVEDRSQTRTAVGVESSLTKNTVAFSEYRLTGGSDGSRNQQSIGLKNKFSLGYGITGNLAFENLRTLTGSEKKNEPDATAVSVGVEYLTREDVKATSRFEYRHSDRDKSYLAELGLTYKLNRDFFFIVKERYFDSIPADEAGRRTTSRTSAGLAYRPAWTNVFNALAKFDYKHERNPSDSSGQSSDSYILSADGTYQLTAKAQLTGKYAGKLTRSMGTGIYTDLISARAIYDITDRIDAGITYRMLTDHHSGTRLHGGAAELGYRVIKNVWLSAGYSFDRFDSDLTQDDYWGQGPYVKLRVKMDERTLRRNK